MKLRLFNPFRALLQLYREMKHYTRILNAASIARRMFVTNSFDGLLSSLGVILGSYIGGTTAPQSYIGSVVGASFAMGFFSGVIATYLSERAERLRELKQTERVLLHPLRGTIYEKAARIVPVYVALWSGFGAMVLPVIGVLPFIIVELTGIVAPVSLLVYLSSAIILMELFLLGVYLGKISGENVILSGVKLSGLGLIAVLFFTALSLVIG